MRNSKIAKISEQYADQYEVRVVCQSKYLEIYLSGTVFDQSQIKIVQEISNEVFDTKKIKAISWNHRMYHIFE